MLCFYLIMVGIGRKMMVYSVFWIVQSVIIYVLFFSFCQAAVLGMKFKLQNELDMEEVRGVFAH